MFHAHIQILNIGSERSFFLCRPGQIELLDQLQLGGAQSSMYGIVDFIQMRLFK